jgi:hypothetical protein
MTKSCLKLKFNDRELLNEIMHLRISAQNNEKIDRELMLKRATQHPLYKMSHNWVVLHGCFGMVL